MGVNHVLKLVPLFIQLVHPFIDTSTFVIGDGQLVSVHVHVIDDVELFRTLFVNIVQLNVGALGTVASIFAIILLVFEDCAHCVSFAYAYAVTQFKSAVCV